MLFALYKGTDLPEYSTLSQMVYILDKDNLLKFFEYFGGLTIRVPTIDELEVFVYALFLYQQCDIEHRLVEEVCVELKNKGLDVDAVQQHYSAIKELLKDYNFNSGRE